MSTKEQARGEIISEILEATARQHGFEMTQLVNHDALIFKCPGAWPVKVTGLEMLQSKDPIGMLIGKLKMAGISMGPKAVESPSQ